MGDGDGDLADQLRPKRDPMVRLGAGQRRRGLDAVDARKLAVLRPAARGEAAGVAQLVRALAQRVGVERDQHTRLVELRHGS